MLGKDKEELDISKELVGEAVTSDDEYTGPAHNSVVSSDGKVQIRNFEVFWTSTDGDTIVNNVTRDSYHYNEYYGPIEKFNSEPKLQINWAISGESAYGKGDLTIDIPDVKAEGEKDGIRYSLSYYSIPMAEFNKDGSVNYSANYGNATFAYYYDKNSESTKITNIQDLAPGASGTLTLTYSKYGRGNYQNIRTGTKAPIEPSIKLNYNGEILKTKDKTLYIQTNTNVDLKINKYPVYNNNYDNVYKEWQDSWGNDAKPDNPEDYWYGVYQLNMKVRDESQTNVNIDLKDKLGKVYTYTRYNGGSGFYANDSGYRGDSSRSDFDKDFPMKEGKILETTSKHSIIGYSDIMEKSQKDYVFKKSDNPDKVSWPTFNVNNKEKYGNNKATSSNYYAYVLIKIPYKKLGLNQKEKSYYLRFDNGMDVTTTPLDSNQEPIKKTTGGNVGTYYTYVPDVEFTAPPGDMFKLEKKAHHTNYDGYYYNGIWNRTEIGDSGWHNGKEKGFNLLYNLYLANEDLYSDRKVQWELNLTSRVANATYDEKYKNDKSPSEAYGKKKIKYELVDDYLYLADDYGKELTPDDYTVNSVEFSSVSAYYYGQPDSKKKANYFKNTENKDIPASIYIRKLSTGEWEKAATFNLSFTSWNWIRNFNPLISGVKQDERTITVPEGYTSIKLEYESSYAGVDVSMKVNGTLHPSERVKKYIDSSKDDKYVMNMQLRNDSTLAAYDEDGNMIGLQGTTESSSNVDRTLELDKKNYGVEMYHSPVHLYLRQEPMPEMYGMQFLNKKINSIWSRNDTFNKQFKVPTEVVYREEIGNYKVYKDEDIRKQYHVQNSGTFYDLLPLGVTGVEDVKISNYRYLNNEHRYDSYHVYEYYDKDTGLNLLSSSYKLIPNWKNSGRTLLIARFDNAELSKDLKYGDKDYNPSASIKLSYDMIYPWDSYKDYGSKIERNLVAYESGFEKRPDDGLDDSLTSELEDGYKDSNPGFDKDYTYVGDAKKYYDKKIYTDQEIEWMKDLNSDHDEKRFLYALGSTTVSGDTEANVGLTKHVSTDINPNFTLKSTTKEGGNYQYKIRLQAAHGTSVSNLVFFDSIENYDPLKADEDYGIKRWRGTLSSIDLTHPIMKGIEPKVYVSTKPKLDIEKHNNVSDSAIWKLYKEGDDLSSVQAVAIDLRKNKDGSDFKLAQDTAINVYLNMKALWNLKEKQIDPKAKALNAIYASNTVTTNLDNKSTKLIYTAYTAVNLKPVTAETQINATKKYLDKEGKNIALKGNDFTFELKDTEGKVLQTKTNDKDGNITFDPIKYNSWDVGEHTYTIEEIKGNDNKIDYDNHVETVKVNVERIGDSELKATVVYDADNSIFTNREKATASLQVVKLIDGTNKVELDPIKDNDGNILSYKVSEKDKDKALDGAEYELYKTSDSNRKNVIATIKTVNGVSNVVSDLEAGKYILKETRAPGGYEINPNKIEINIEEKDLGTIKIAFVNDKAKANMPSTGMLPAKFLISGLNVVLLFMGLHLIRKKKTDLHR